MKVLKSGRRQFLRLCWSDAECSRRPHFERHPQPAAFVGLDGGKPQPGAAPGDFGSKYKVSWAGPGARKSTDANLFSRPRRSPIARLTSDFDIDSIVRANTGQTQSWSRFRADYQARWTAFRFRPSRVALRLGLSHGNFDAMSAVTGTYPIAFSSGTLCAPS